MTTWVSRRAEYQQLARTIEPSALVVSKDHWVWTLLWVVGLILTVGILAAVVPLSSWRRRAATVGPAAGYPRGWDHLTKRTVVHEAEHSWWYQLFGWLFIPLVALVASLFTTWWCMLFGLFTLCLLGLPRSLRGWLGVLPFWLFYFILPFPVMLCYPRYRLELAADRRSWRWMLKNGYTPGDVRLRAAEFGGHVGGKQYGWSWPKFWVMWGFKRAAEREIEKAAKTA